MNELVLFQTTLIAAAFVVFLIKTAHYMATIRRKSIINWFYFNFYSIVNSQTEESERAKRLQNKLTVIMTILVLIVFFSLVINWSLQIYFPQLVSHTS